MEAAIKIGECIVVQSILVVIFIALAALSNIKFGLIYKFIKVIAGMFVGACIGAFIVSLFAMDWTYIGFSLGLIIGGVFGFSMLNSS